MYGFWDSEVLLQAGYDVIVISSLGAFHTSLVDKIWWATRFHDHGSFTYFAYLLPFRSYSKFYLWLAIAYSDHFWGCFKRSPKFQNYTFLIPKRVFLTLDRVFELLCAKIGSRVWAVALLKNKQKTKNTIKKSQYPYMLPSRVVSNAHRTQTKFGRAGNLPRQISNRLKWNCDFGEE